MRWTLPLLIVPAMLTLSSSVGLAAPSAPPRPVVQVTDHVPPSPRALENLTAFTHLLGYVRFFHPSDQAVALDWDRFAVQHIVTIEHAKDANELASRLQEAFLPVAPTVRICPGEQMPELSTVLLPPKGSKRFKVVQWHYEGLASSASGSGTEYSSGRRYFEGPLENLPQRNHKPGEPFKASLGGGVSCLVPLALYADEKGTLPHAPLVSQPKVSQDAELNRAKRLAAIVATWNYFQHFYPYFDVVKTDWKKTLTAGLQEAAIAKGRQEFEQALYHLLAEAHDGHADATRMPRDETNDYWPPFANAWVEERLLITRVGEHAPKEIVRGAEIIDVEGEPIAPYFNRFARQFSASTPQWRRHVANVLVFKGPKDSLLTLSLRNPDGKAQSVMLKRSDFVPEAKPAGLSEVKPGIFYIGVGRVTQQEVETAWPRIASSKGLIVDLREYPQQGVGSMVIRHLIDRPVKTPPMWMPIYSRPNQEVVRWIDEQFEIKPQGPTYRGKVVFLSAGKSISAQEFLLDTVKGNKIAPIVGETTAGTDGDIIRAMIPGNYKITWTGLKVLKYDGTQFHGVGVIPDFPVHRTYQGVLEGRDEILNKALELLSKP